MTGARHSMYGQGSKKTGTTLEFAPYQYASATLPSINGKYALSFGMWQKVNAISTDGGHWNGLNWPESGGWGWTICCSLSDLSNSFAWAGMGRNHGARINDGTCGRIGEWHHLFTVFNGTSVKFYFDGVLDKTVSFSRMALANNGSLVRLGINDAPGFRVAYVGACIFDRELSAQDVEAVRDVGFAMDASKPPFSIGLMAGWNCVDGSGGSMANIKSGGPALQISGADRNWTERVRLPTF